ncbi:hypothetical protein RRF57_001232 [Xylaria bambusicola]|uniref:Uncharacterized protein n=1 Tax=Xylaria bambusicola TaxID=326684 RepID=A0AAN7UH03_9PEZI
MCFKNKRSLNSAGRTCSLKLNWESSFSAASTALENFAGWAVDSEMCFTSVLAIDLIAAATPTAVCGSNM